MADTAGQADLRGIDIQKLAVAYEEEARLFKNFVRVSPTSAREIRWYRKNAGIISTPTTTGSTVTVANVSHGAKPNVMSQGWTRVTSYVRKYFVESEPISEEDIKDSDIDLLAGHLRDLVIKVEYDVDSRIWDVLTESRSVVNINTNASTAAWDAASGQDPVEDILEGLQNIRTNTYEKVMNPVLFLSPKDYKSLLTWLISTKGSSIPNFTSERVKDGVMTEFLGCKVVVSNNVTADYALVADPYKACVWKEFTPITAFTVEDRGVGVKVRALIEGEAILERPKFCNLITNTQA